MADCIIIGNDHGGYEAKLEVAAHLREKGFEVVDAGSDSTQIVRYPVYVRKVAGAVARGQFARGILICSTGIGMSIAANKVEGIRAGVVYDERTARVSRSHNDTNVLCLGEDTVQGPLLDSILKIWLDTPAEAGRHERRVGKIMEYERQKRAAQKAAQT